MPKIRVKSCFRCLICIALFVCVAYAHDGLHEQIVAVTDEIAKNPQNAALYLKRAELYRLHKEWKASEKDFETAEKLAPDLMAVDLGRGKLLFDTRRFQKARLALEKFLRRAQDAFEGVLMLARTLGKLNKTDEAARYFTRAIELSKADSAEIYLERAMVLSRAKRFAEALQGLDEGLEKLGPLVTLQTTAVELETARRNFDGALARLDKMMADLPRKETFLLKKGEILLTAKRNCEARKSLLEAQKGFEDYSSFRRNVRAVREQLARLEKLLNKTKKQNCSQN